jgi:hypothetical protein
MSRIIVLDLVLLAGLLGCRAPSRMDDIILSYSESNTFCVGCPKPRVDFRAGVVNYECLGDCAVPGEQHYLVPAQGPHLCRLRTSVTRGISTLLDAGADPTIRDKRGKTALEPQLVSVGDPKCATAQSMIEDSARSWRVGR